MAHHARIEEVSDSDSDPDVMDPADFDPGHYSNSIISPTNIPSTSNAPSEPMLQPTIRSEGQQNADRERSKNWQAVYPCYFDNTRSRIEGRRVKQNEAIANPLAREIVDAVQSLGLVPIFEPGKTHPKDWSNPGRVRVQIKKEGRPVTRNIKNKHHLYKLIAAYLQSHPTNPSTPLRLRVAGLPPPKEPNPPPAVPRGWKIGTILPLHSPALSGGGVSDNILKDMMAEMQGQLPEGSGSAEARKKKEKKKVKG